MKKLITPLFILLVTSATAQITIVKADMPIANDTFRLSQGNVVGIPDPTITGTNTTWDYSGLIPFIQNKDTFASVSSTPFLYQLYFNNPGDPTHKATCALRTQDINATVVTFTSIYNYFKVSTSTTGQYSQVGFGANINGIPASVAYDSVDIHYKFPMNYDDRDSSISKYKISVPGIGYYGQRKRRVNHVEGWGTVITPFGSFQALKVKSTLYTTDTIFYTGLGFGISIPRPTSYEYKWLATSKKIPVLQINTLGAAVTSVAYYDSIRAVPQVGIHEDLMNSISFSAYPNPVKEQLNVSYSLERLSAVKIELLDMLGQSVSTFVDQKQVAGNYSFAINTNSINGKGFYFLKTSVDSKVAIKKLILE